MLKLERKTGQAVVIGEGEDAIVIVVNRVGGKRVRLGITAPRAMKILRGEAERWPEPSPREGEVACKS